MRKAKILFILASFLLCISGYIGYLFVTYIDDTIASGSGYGFEIGDSKEDVLITLQDLYSDNEISLEKTKYDQRPPEYLRLDFEKDISSFYEEEVWRFYLCAGSDSLTLYFNGENLVKIHRHRQYFEFP